MKESLKPKPKSTDIPMNETERKKELDRIDSLELLYYQIQNKPLVQLWKMEKFRDALGPQKQKGRESC